MAVPSVGDVALDQVHLRVRMGLEVHDADLGTSA
jgi:hypothetical protein